MTVENESYSQHQLWSIRLVAGMHFTRLIAILYATSSNIYMFVSGFMFDPLLLTVITPIIILELLFGFLIILRKTIAIYPATIYTFIFLFVTYILVNASPYNLFSYILFYPTLIESLLIGFLGIMWIKGEWVHNDSD